MTVDTTGSPSGRRRERQTGHRRKHRFYVSFDDAELEVVRTAASREEMATAAWAGRQLIAVAQHVLVPVSRDADDVLRELVTARVRLRETVTALRALTAPVPPATAPSAPVPVSTDTLPDTLDTLPNAPARVLPDAVRVVLEEALSAVRGVDEATVRVMRERRPRS
ncbi:hypothetical protein [Streptomyces sp. EN16]|uniref:hypothetical protein n=1 Tax=Streptomyces sp. EN16 TaxID=212773 RepID=UPI0008519314|nr:hypothetical protein [Streptomyces sp. EN16]